MTPHAKLCKEICAELDAWCIYNVRTNSHGYGRKGIPDILACQDGKFVAIEAKVLPDTPSTWQLRELNAIDAAGGLAITVYSIGDVQRALFRKA
jgi:hypothetical protein